MARQPIKKSRTNLAPRAYTLRTFSEVYGTSVRTARREIIDGNLRAVRCGGSRLLIPQEAAEAWFASLEEIRTAA